MTSSSDHTDAVRDLVESEPVHDGDQPTVVGRLQRLCRAARRDLPASGVGVSVVSERGSLLTAAASGSDSARIEELQFALGEGPCLSAIAFRRPVLVPDLLVDGASTWPGYAPAAHRHGVRAVFAFPLRVGAARLGALDVYRDRPGALSSWTSARALGFADVAVQTMLEAEQSGEMVTGLADASETRFEVYQAHGMVLVQLGVTAAEALARIRAYAYLHDQTLVEVAEGIIARRLTMEPDEAGP